MDLQSFYQGLRNISEQIVYMLTCINNNGFITLTVAAKSCYKIGPLELPNGTLQSFIQFL